MTKHLPQLQLLAWLLLLPAANSGKLGLCCMGCNATQYVPLGTLSSSDYRYQLWVDDPGAAQWLVDNQVEFVPHLAHHHVPLPWGGACDFFSGPNGAGVPLCTDAMLDRAIAFAKGQGLAIRHLMGWNEAYDEGNDKATKKYIQPAVAATYWRTHVQGMAARNNLTLVSPTTGVEKKKLTWLADMLLACWAQRSQGCDVESIAAFSVHDYKCAEPYWRQNYGRGGLFQRKLAAHLTSGHSSGGKNWTRYVDERLIWVTETNCNGDTGFPPTALVSAQEQVRERLVWHHSFFQ
eukprot:COSAG02_NODE_8469_length_2562_cov_1.366220_3_plen_292_part_00